MALYQSLTSSSTPEQIAAAYAEFAAGAGGDTAANQKAALDYLSNLGVKQGAIDTAYSSYKASPAYRAPVAAPVMNPEETLLQQIRAINQATGGSNWQGSWMSGGDNAITEAANG